jgi:hypothetical protein
MTLLKVSNSTVMGINDNAVHVISGKKYKRKMIIIVNGIKEDTKKYLSAVQENTNKQLSGKSAGIAVWLQ